LSPSEGRSKDGPSHADRIRAALLAIDPNGGFEQMDDEVLTGAVIWAAIASPRNLTMEEAVQILERVAARDRDT
jgi:hypothetical protein